MSRGGRLPVAPRPFKDELSSSWLGRVACRYGLNARDLAGWWAADGDCDAPPISVDAIAPREDQIKVWARSCGIDPMRVRQMSLLQRHPGRALHWFSARERPQVPVCASCFDVDCAAGRDSYLRADWMLAERCACPEHRRMLVDRCPSCDRHLNVCFRMRGGYARAVCGWCEALLTGRGGEDEQYPDVDFVAAVLGLQNQISGVVTGGPMQRESLERTIETLWAPLDQPGAARPVLALWFDRPGWHCPFEVRHVVGAAAPFGQLPIRWRSLTLVVLRDLFGSKLYGDRETSAVAANLFRRAAPQQTRRSAASRVLCRGKTTPKRVPADYARLACEILAHPDWSAVEDLSERRRGTKRARLVDKVLAKNSASDIGSGMSPQIEREGSPPIKREFARRESVF